MIYKTFGIKFPQKEREKLILFAEMSSCLASKASSFEDGSELFSTALSIFKMVHEGKPHLDIATTLVSMTGFCAKHKKWTEAVSHSSSALPIYQELDQNQSSLKIAITLDLIGAGHLALGNFQESIQNFNLALSNYRAIYGEGTYPNVMRTLLGLAAAYNGAKDFSNYALCAKDGLLMKRALEGDQATFELAEELKKTGKRIQANQPSRNNSALYRCSLDLPANLQRRAKL